MSKLFTALDIFGLFCFVFWGASFVVAGRLEGGSHTINDDLLKCCIFHLFTIMDTNILIWFVDACIIIFHLSS